MANSKQNGTPLFVTPDPIVNPGAHYTSPDSAYPQMCMCITPQQQQPSVSCKDNVLFGNTSVIWLGAALLLCGVLSQIGAAVAFRLFAGLSEVGVGVWCGYMFSAAGAVAIVAAHHENKELNSAVAANSMMVFAACMALIGGARLFRIAGIAVCGEQTSFQDVSTPVQLIPNASQHNIYEDIRNKQIHSTPVQYVQQQQQQQLMPLNSPHPITIHPSTSSQIHSTSVQQVHQQQQQQQQLMPLNHPHPSTIHPPVSSQVDYANVMKFQLRFGNQSPNDKNLVVQMPAAYIPLQTMTTSTIPSQQMLSVPIQYVLPHQQLISLNLNHPSPNTIDPATSAQVHVHHEAPRMSIAMRKSFRVFIGNKTLSVSKE